jgi:Ca-activated chloride channel family protein
VEVHGSPSADADADRLMHVGTLFPSAKEDGEARGGVVLARLEATNMETDGNLELVASWTERNGEEHTERVSVQIPDAPESFTHDGVRKAVALTRYARELRTWTRDVHNRADSATGVDDWLLPDSRNQHERESIPLVVPDQYAERFEQLRGYLDSEMTTLEDETLQQEVDLLRSLCQEVPTSPREVTNE